MTNKESWVFIQEIQKKYKNKMFWVKNFVIALFCWVAWIAYALYTQTEQQDFIKQQKQQEINKINESFDKNLEKEKKTIDNLLNQNVDVNVKPVQENENKNEVTETNLVKNVVTQTSKDSQSQKTDWLKDEKSEDLKKLDTTFVWDFCIYWSWDNDKINFFNSFDYSNQHLVRTYQKKLELDSIQYKIYCFTGVKMTNWYVDAMIKEYKKAIKDKNKEEVKNIAKKYFQNLQRKANGFYEINLTKKNWMSEISRFDWCWNDNTMALILEQIGVVPFNQKELNNGYNSWKISWSSHCKMPKIWNIFWVQKNITTQRYYNDLFKSTKVFNENKSQAKYSWTYWELNYNQGLEAFVKFMNEETFKNSYSLYTNWDNLEHDYINQKRKNLFRNATTILAQMLNR